MTEVVCMSPVLCMQDRDTMGNTCRKGFWQGEWEQSTHLKFWRWACLAQELTTLILPPPISCLPQAPHPHTLPATAPCARFGFLRPPPMRGTYVGVNTADSASWQHNPNTTHPPHSHTHTLPRYSNTSPPPWMSKTPQVTLSRSTE